MTILDAIIQSLSRAGEYNRDDQVAPAVILWPDKERQWEPVLPVLRERLPHLLTLGPYAANCKTGPAIWLRCMIGRTLPEANWSEKTIPILYLPGVSRQELRAVAECPPALMPLAELQYRGAFWSQVNHKDWTVLAFLQSADGGLGLDVARDTATLDAMKTALVKLVETDIQDLTGHRLEASDFHALLSPDPVREILAWMNDPKASQAKLTAQQWEAFCHSCKDKFGFHPTKDGPLRAAEMMGLRQGNWGQVWDRFREAPRRYPNLPGWLRKAKPQDDDLFLKESDEVWPQSNEIHETALRNVLKGCAGKTAQAVVERIKEMEAVHGKRRSWVWAELDLAPLAVALKHLTTVAETCGKPVAGGALDDVVAGYVNGGWCADAAVVDALGVVEKKDDIEAVQAVIRAVYLPWLEASALAFQKLVCGATVPVAFLRAGNPEACSTFGQVLQQTVYFNPYEPIEISERNLPHWRQPNVTYFVTFRLADALPAEKLTALKAEREAWIKNHPEPHSITDQEEYHRLFSERIQDWLDAGSGSCLLRDERVGAIVAGALRHFEGQRYTLGSWVVMPNHVHAVVAPNEGWSLDQILHSWKSFTAHEINKLLHRTGPVWQHEGYDHIVRNPRALWKIEEYIADNPRKAGIQTKFIHSRLPDQSGATVSVAKHGKPEACPTLSDIPKGTAILFADGLRFDLAQKLKAKLAEKGLQLELTWRWTALPTVTPTAKPAASPIAELFTGDEGCEEFRPRIKSGATVPVAGGKPEACPTLTSERFKQLLEERGCQVLGDKKLGQPDGVAWLECGSIDSTGHKEGWKLAKRVPEELEGLLGAIVGLLEGGWKKVRVVTDHGWLLVPGGLPKFDLPKYLAETRWGRCALIKEGVQSELPSVPWHWASTVHVAVPPGVGAFKASLEYAHGGLSVQECLVPELTVSSAAPVEADIAIVSAKWVGLRCRVQASAGAVALLADIRESIADKATSLVAKPKEIEPDGQTSLLVLDDRKSGAKATVVLVDASDTVVAKFPTVIGE